MVRLIMCSVNPKKKQKRIKGINFILIPTRHTD